MRTRAVIFDMDGVLADTEPLHYEAAREVLAAAGHELTWEANREFFGRTTRHVFETIEGAPPPAPAPRDVRRPV